MFASGNHSTVSYRSSAAIIPDESTSEKIDEATLVDMRSILETSLEDITTKYARYVDCLRASIEKKKFSLDNLRTFLLAIPAFRCSSKGVTLTALSDEEAELSKKRTLNEIFDFLITRYSSFLNYEIFEKIRTYYKISADREELKYKKHLKLFLEKHKISAFAKINPHLKKCDTLTVKFDVERMCNLAKVSELKKFVARALDLDQSALRIINVTEGCIVVTFLIPTAVGKTLFSHHAKFSLRQEDLLRQGSVLWLNCNGHTFHIPKLQNGETHLAREGKHNNYEQEK